MKTSDPNHPKAPFMLYRPLCSTKNSWRYNAWLIIVSVIPHQTWASPLPVRFGVKLRYSIRAVVGIASN